MSYIVILISFTAISPSIGYDHAENSLHIYIIVLFVETPHKFITAKVINMQ
jgi:hypothetical protein